MGFKVSDREMAYDVALVTDGVSSLASLGEQFLYLVNLLTATGIQSSAISSALETEKEDMQMAINHLQTATASIVDRTNSFVEQLDADDAKFD
jgi:hypothetical protein